MRGSVPSPGDFVVEYRQPVLERRSSARIVVVHLTHDAGPEELFSSDAPHCGGRAEDLAALWALEDGACAWRVIRGAAADAVAERIGIDGRLRGSLRGEGGHDLPGD